MWAVRVSQFARCASAGSAGHEPLGRKHRRETEQSPLESKAAAPWCRAAVRSTRPHLSSSGNARRQRRHCRFHERTRTLGPSAWDAMALLLSAEWGRAPCFRTATSICPRADPVLDCARKGDSAAGGACKVLASTRAVMCSKFRARGRAPGAIRCARYRGSRSLLPQTVRQDATQRHLFRISTRLRQALRGSTRCRSQYRATRLGQTLGLQLERRSLQLTPGSTGLPLKQERLAYVAAGGARSAQPQTVRPAG